MQATTPAVAVTAGTSSGCSTREMPVALSCDSRTTCGRKVARETSSLSGCCLANEPQPAEHKSRVLSSVFQPRESRNKACTHLIKRGESRKGRQRAKIGGRGIVPAPRAREAQRNSVSSTSTTCQHSTTASAQHNSVSAVYVTAQAHR